MSPTPEFQNDDLNREHGSQTHEIRYLAKYSSYELWLAVPRPSPSPPDPELSMVQLRFKDPHLPDNVVLSVGEFKAFYDALSRLMEYVHQEFETRK
jgi:hypothetical protein